MKPLNLLPHDHVLFIGDSITNAFRMPGEVNDAYQMGMGYAGLIAGRLKRDHPSHGLRFSNRGVSGHAVPDLAARWRGDCLDLAPTVLSILIGINDSNRHKDKEVDSFEVGLLSLIERAQASRADLRVVLVEPFASPGPHCCIDAPALAGLKLRQAIVGEVARRIGATLILTQALFDQALTRAPGDYWIYDGIHPTAAGHVLLADAWLDAARIQTL